MAVPIVFNSINVNALNINASISVGQNTQTNWDSHQKRNIGNGLFFGINYSLNTFNYIFDPDGFDALINDPDIVSSGQNQQV